MEGLEVEGMETVVEEVTQGGVMGVEKVGKGVAGMVILVEGVMEGLEGVGMVHLVGVGVGMEVGGLEGVEAVVKVGVERGLGAVGLVGVVMGVGVGGDTACRSSGSSPCITTAPLTLPCLHKQHRMLCQQTWLSHILTSSQTLLKSLDCHRTWSTHVLHAAVRLRQTGYMSHRKYCPTCPGRVQSCRSWQIDPQSLAKSTQVPWLPPGPGAPAAGVTDGPAGLGIAIVPVIPGVEPGAGDVVGGVGNEPVAGDAGGDAPDGVVTGDPDAPGDDSGSASAVGVGGKGIGGEVVGTSEAWFPLNGGEAGTPWVPDGLTGAAGGVAAGVPGVATGALGIAAGVPPVEVGLPGGPVAGVPGVLGVPGVAAGVLGVAAGVPGDAAGVPGVAAGEPGVTAGVPGVAAGVPGVAAGVPGVPGVAGAPDEL